jgi:predicted membrane GTPase involved in stress response
MGALARGYVKEIDFLDLKYSAKSIVELDKGFAGIATPTKLDILYRGVSRRLTENVKVGDIISDQGFTSTSSSETIAKEFGSGVDFFHFKKMANVMAINMAETGLATHREAEYVLPRLQKFRVTKVKRGPVNIITLVPIK